MLAEVELTICVSVFCVIFDTVQAQTLDCAPVGGVTKNGTLCAKCHPKS